MDICPTYLLDCGGRTTRNIREPQIWTTGLKSNGRQHEGGRGSHNTNQTLRFIVSSNTIESQKRCTHPISLLLFNMTLDPQLLTGVGCAASIFLCAAGSAYASSYSGVYAMRSSDIKGFAPIVISGVLAIYGIIVSVMLAFKLNNLSADSIMTQGEGYRNLSAGLSVGFACLASGVGMAFFIKELNQQEHHHHNPTWSVTPAA